MTIKRLSIMTYRLVVSILLALMSMSAMNVSMSLLTENFNTSESRFTATMLGIGLFLIAILFCMTCVQHHVRSVKKLLIMALCIFAIFVALPLIYSLIELAQMNLPNGYGFFAKAYLIFGIVLLPIGLAYFSSCLHPAKTTQTTA